ncbi:MAG: hypothetical protein PHI97_04555 [Desulfobulbus sp.]|nr:hypothetical protein [Desulfobulbus sp.]
MLLYVITVTFIVCLSLAFKGPAELYFLKQLGYNLVSVFEANIQVQQSHAAIKGSIVIAILIVQPLVFSVIFLKILDKLLKTKIVTEVEKVVHIQPRSLDRQESWLKRQGEKFKNRKIERNSNKYDFQISSLDKNGHASASIDDLINDLINNVFWKFSVIEISNKISIFRGSLVQYVLSLFLIAYSTIEIFYNNITLSCWITFVFLLVFTGPSFGNYFLCISRFQYLVDEYKKEIALRKKCIDVFRFLYSNCLEIKNYYKELYDINFELKKQYYKKQHLESPLHYIHKFILNEELGRRISREVKIEISSIDTFQLKDFYLFQKKRTIKKR